MRKYTVILIGQCYVSNVEANDPLDAKRVVMRDWGLSLKHIVEVI